MITGAATNSPKLSTDVSSALRVLEILQDSVERSNDDQLKSQTRDDFRFLISTLQNPILRSIIVIQESLIELDKQFQKHPSIVPDDFQINESGELELAVQFSILDQFFRSLSNESADQRVPVVGLSSPSSGSLTPLANTISKDYTALVTKIFSSEKPQVQHRIEERVQRRKTLQVKAFGQKETSIIGSTRRDGELIDNYDYPRKSATVSQNTDLEERFFTKLTENCPKKSVKVKDSNLSRNSEMVLSSDWAQVEVIDLINDGSGLGFGIVGGKSTGVVVKTVSPGGISDKDGRLQSGDHILQIGDVNLRGMGSEQVAAVLRQTGSHVRIVVARPVDGAEYHSQNTSDCLIPIVPSNMLGDPDELNRYLKMNGYDEITAAPLDIMEVTELDLINSICNGSNINMHEFPILTMDMISANTLTNLPEMDKFEVNIEKGVHGLGVTIAGYVCEREELSGIFIKGISEGSAADLCGLIQVNDRIVEVDGKSLQGMTNHEAVEILRSTDQMVNLSLERYLRGPKYEQLQQAIANCEGNKPQIQTSPSVTSLLRFPIVMVGNINHQ